MNFLKPSSYTFLSTFTLSFLLLLLTCLHFITNIKEVASQTTVSSSSSRAECLSQEGQLMGSCNSSKPTVELIVDNSHDNCCQAMGYYRCLRKLVTPGVQCEAFIRDRAKEYDELLDMYDCDDVRC